MNLGANRLVCFCLLWPAIAFAQTYTFQDGYYYSATGVPHVRRATTDAYGCVTYRYEPVAVPESRVNLRTETRDWRSDLTEAVKAAVQYQGATDRAVAEYSAFGNALQAVLGGRGVVRGYDPYTGAIGGTPYAGNTVYGQRVESYSTTADFLGQLDPNVLGERYARAVEGLGPQQQQALQGLKESVDQTSAASQTAAAQAARVEALRALPDLIRAFMDPQTTVRTQRTVRSSLPLASAAGAFPLLGKYCATCHAGDGAKADVVLDGSVKLDDVTASKASIAVLWGKGLANAATAKRHVKAAMPPKSSEQIADADLPGVLAEIGRLTR